MKRCCSSPLLLVAVMLSGCGPSDQELQRRQAAYNAKQEEDRAKRAAEIERERQLITASTGVQELERRLGEWLTTKTDVPTVIDRKRSGEFIQMYGFSHHVPWAISCGRGVEVVLGSWVEMSADEGSADRSDRHAIMLTRAKLTEAECAPLIAGLGRTMTEIFRGGVTSDKRN